MQVPKLLDVFSDLTLIEVTTKDAMVCLVHYFGSISISKNASSGIFATFDTVILLLRIFELIHY